MFHTFPFFFFLIKVYYSVVSALVATIPVVLIICLFRKARLRTESGRYFCWERHTERDDKQIEDGDQIWNGWKEELVEGKGRILCKKKKADHNALTYTTISQYLRANIKSTPTAFEGVCVCVEE